MSNSHWDWGQITAPIYAGVHIKGAGLYDVLMNGNDAQVDALIDELQSFGMEELHLTGHEAEVLASHGVTFEAGLDVVVEGTSFLNAPAASVQALLGDADVEVTIDWTGFGKVLAGGQGGLDDYLDKLEDAGVDAAVFDAGQITKLAKAGLHFGHANPAPAGGPTLLGASGNIEIHIADPSFLADPYGYGADLDDIKALFDGADVTVDLPKGTIDALIAQGDAAFDSLMDLLQDVGAEAQIDADLLQDLLDSGITVDGDVSLTVEGTSFLSSGKQFADGADITMVLSDDFVDQLAGNLDGAGAFVAKALEANIDTLASTEGEVDLAEALGEDGELSADELADILDQLSGNSATPAFAASDLPTDDGEFDLAALTGGDDLGAEPAPVDAADSGDLTDTEAQLLGLIDETDAPADSFDHKG